MLGLWVAHGPLTSEGPGLSDMSANASPRSAFSLTSAALAYWRFWRSSLTQFLRSTRSWNSLSLV